MPTGAPGFEAVIVARFLEERLGLADCMYWEGGCKARTCTYVEGTEGSCGHVCPGDGRRWYNG